MTVIDSAPRTTTIDPRSDAAGWVDATTLESLTPGRGVAVLMPSGRQAALFRTADHRLFAVDNIDPFGRAAVMSRGLVGDRAGEPTVASPLLKQVFSLVDGRCLDDPAVRLASYPVRVHDGIVAVHVVAHETPGGQDSGTETTSR